MRLRCCARQNRADKIKKDVLNSSRIRKSKPAENLLSILLQILIQIGRGKLHVASLRRLNVRLLKQLGPNKANLVGLLAHALGNLGRFGMLLIQME